MLMLQLNMSNTLSKIDLFLLVLSDLYGTEVSVGLA